MDEVGPIGSVSSNDTVRANLLTHGDDGSAVREVEHFAYSDPNAPDPMPEAEVIEAMSDRGFVVNVMQGEDGARWLAFVRNQTVAGADFDAFTDWFVKNMANLGWVYDGWSCSVVPAEKDI